MQSLFTRRYSNQYDAQRTTRWMREIVLPSMMSYDAIRTDDALCITLLSSYPWLPSEKEAVVVVILADFGKVWQTLPLLRASIEWARRSGAVRWRCQSDTGNELGPLMRRLRVPQDHARYKLELRDVDESA